MKFSIGTQVVNFADLLSGRYDVWIIQQVQSGKRCNYYYTIFRADGTSGFKSIADYREKDYVDFDYIKKYNPELLV